MKTLPSRFARFEKQNPDAINSTAVRTQKQTNQFKPHATGGVKNNLYDFN